MCVCRRIPALGLLLSLSFRAREESRGLTVAAQKFRQHHRQARFARAGVVPKQTLFTSAMARNCDKKSETKKRGRPKNEKKKVSKRGKVKNANPAASPKKSNNENIVNENESENHVQSEPKIAKKRGRPKNEDEKVCKRRKANNADPAVSSKKSNNNNILDENGNECHVQSEPKTAKKRGRPKNEKKKVCKRRKVSKNSNPAASSQKSNKNIVDENGNECHEVIFYKYDQIIF